MLLIYQNIKENTSTSILQYRSGELIANLPVFTYFNNLISILKKMLHSILSDIALLLIFLRMVPIYAMYRSYLDIKTSEQPKDIPRLPILSLKTSRVL